MYVCVHYIYIYIVCVYRYIIKTCAVCTCTRKGIRGICTYVLDLQFFQCVNIFISISIYIYIYIFIYIYINLYIYIYR